jgi:NAD(P)-dependent dehydrogenase (short-subunit alcohol dehydrogenase family)
MATPLVAIVTAGSAGLGAATAKLFAQNGMRVVINYSSNSDRAEALVKELEGSSPLTSTASKNFVAIRADLSSRVDIQRLIEEAVSIMGRIDAVFSNGGWTHLRNIADLDDNMNEEDWDRCFQMNVKSHLFLMHAARKYLDETCGVFVTTASLAGVKFGGSSLVSSPSSNSVHAYFSRQRKRLYEYLTIVISYLLGLFCYQGRPDSFGKRTSIDCRPKDTSKQRIARFDVDGMYT